jgi:indole-3-glycerol phosphate synthase
MNILDKIIIHKREEVAVRRLMVAEEQLRQSVYFAKPSLSMKKNLIAKVSTGIIAEFKRKSPSKGFINQHADVQTITRAYTQYGASGISVLTDNEFFGGSTEDLVIARENKIPILRKDFIIDPYQVLAAKAMGADVILLIAACLSPGEVHDLAVFAKETGLEVLLELHDETELTHICDAVDMVGVNNRNLKTFKVDIKQSLKLGDLIPAGKIKIAESGIDDVQTIMQFKEAGFNGFLMGEKFMKEPDPGKAFMDFVKESEEG